MNNATHHALESFLGLPETSGDNAPVQVVIDSDRSFINIRAPGGGPGLPTAANTFVTAAATTYWLGPDEWLCAGTLADAKAAAGNDATFVDVSDGYIELSISGANAADVIAKGCTLDLHPEVFRQGQCAQTSIARADVLIARPGAETDLRLIVRRSFAEYLALWLRNAAAHEGVSFHAPAGN